MNNPSRTDPSGSSPTPIGTKPGRKTSPKAVFLAAALILGVGVGLGFGCYSLGFRHPRGGIFKLLVGLPLGLVGLVLLYLLKISPRHVLTLAGLGAVATLLSIHYFEYRDIPDAWTRELKYVALAHQVEGIQQLIRESEMTLDKAVAAERERPNARRRELIKEHDARLREMREKAPARLELDPERARKADPLLQRFRGDTQTEAVGGGRDEVERLGPWVEGLGFWEFLDLKAQRGEIFEIFGKTIHLGYRTSYLVWVGEVLLAALIMVLLMRKLARDKELKETFRNMERDFREQRA